MDTMLEATSCSFSVSKRGSEDFLVRYRVRQYVDGIGNYYVLRDWQDASGGLEEFSLWVPKGYVMAGYPTLLEFQFMTADRPQFALGTGTEISDIRIQFTKWVLESRLVRACEEGEDYRFGFAAGEKLNEIAGVGNHVDLGERGVDTRIVRLNWKPDPMVKQFPSQSPYVYANNSPIAMIDKEGKHGEIVIDKGKQEQGKPQVWTITATAVYVTSKEHLNASNANWEAYDRFPLEHSATFGKKIFSGESGGVSYNAKFKSSFVTFATTQEAISNLRANPVFNYITFNTGVKNPTAVGNGRYLNYNTLQRNKPNSFGHEESHIWGEQGDWRAKYDNYMSGYGLDRDVQGQEINDILSPAIELAKESKDQNVTIRVFPTQGEDGKPSDNKTTYKIYNPETKEYGKSVTVDAVNSQ